jgi:hypothetical protein
LQIRVDAASGATDCGPHLVEIHESILRMLREGTEDDLFQFSRKLRAQLCEPCRICVWQALQEAVVQ